MREIKFRGKRKDNDEWMYGSICEHDHGVISHIGQDLRDGSMVVVDLDPATVGQFTGLKDKNGGRIYEGDIVECVCKEGRFTASVEFGNPNAEYSWGWQLKRINGDKFNEDILLWVETEIDYVTCELVGNIYGAKA